MMAAFAAQAVLQRLLAEAVSAAVILVADTSRLTNNNIIG